MSAGRFVITFYETDSGQKAPARVQEETLTANVGGSDNAGAAGPATAGLPRIKISGSRRAHGIHPRTCRIRFVGNTAPTGYLPNQSYSIPVFVRTTWLNITDGMDGTYLGMPVKIVSKDSEKIK